MGQLEIVAMYSADQHCNRWRRLETYLEMLGPDDPVLDRMAELAEQRLIELSEQKKPQSSEQLAKSA